MTHSKCNLNCAVKTKSNQKRRVSEAENSTQEAQLEVPISTCVSDPTSDMRWWMETDCTQFIAIKGFPDPCFRWPIWTITWVDLFVCPCAPMLSYVNPFLDSKICYNNVRDIFLSFSNYFHWSMYIKPIGNGGLNIFELVNNSYLLCKTVGLLKSIL